MRMETIFNPEETCKDLTIMLTSITADCDFCEASLFFEYLNMKNLEYSIMKKTHDENLWDATKE